MDADFQALRQFAEPPPAVSSHGFPLFPAPTSGGPTRVLTLDPKGLTTERYRELLGRFRASIAERLPSGPYRIEVLDRTAPDLDLEARRAFPWKGGYAETLAQPWGVGAFFSPIHSAAGPGCSVTGFPPVYDIRGRLSRPLRGAAVETGPLDAEAFHWFALMHEVGHCLLGNSEARADAFAALMALHEERVTVDQISAIARYREADEWTSPEPGDDHVVSGALWEVVRRAGGLAGSRAFMAMSVEEVASLAREVANDYGPTLDEVWDMQDARRAILAAAAVPEPPGDAEGSPRPSFADWVRSHPGQPVLARLGMALGNLATGGGPPPRFRIDLAGFRTDMARLAGQGDVRAAAAVAALDAKGPPRHMALDIAADIPLARMAPPVRLQDIPEDARAGGP